jgi:hypothetical protein
LADYVLWIAHGRPEPDEWDPTFRHKFEAAFAEMKKEQDISMTAF